MTGPTPRIQHVAVNVPSEHLLGETEAFYKTLGGVPLARPSSLENDTPGRWLGFGETQLHLLLGEPLPSGAHFALDLGSSYDSVLFELENGGAQMRPGRAHWDGRRTFVRDPAGNWVELFDKPPSFEPL